MRGVCVHIPGILGVTINTYSCQGYFPGFKVQLLCSIDINNIYDGSDNSQPTSTYLKWKRFKHQKFCIENILNKDKADGNTGFDFTI